MISMVETGRELLRYNGTQNGSTDDHTSNSQELGDVATLGQGQVLSRMNPSGRFGTIRSRPWAAPPPQNGIDMPCHRCRRHFFGDWFLLPAIFPPRILYIKSIRKNLCK